MVTWYKRLKDWEKLLIAAILGISGTLGLRAYQAHRVATVKAECDRLNQEVNSFTVDFDNKYAEYKAKGRTDFFSSDFDYKLQDYKMCKDKLEEVWSRSPWGF